jgi:hypothetical protein
MKTKRKVFSTQAILFCFELLLFFFSHSLQTALIVPLRALRELPAIVHFFTTIRPHQRLIRSFRIEVGWFVRGRFFFYLSATSANGLQNGAESLFISCFYCLNCRVLYFRIWKRQLFGHMMCIRWCVS